jgi:hypothetical protein
MKRFAGVVIAVALLSSAPAFAQSAPPSVINGLRVVREDIGKPGPRSSRDYLVDVRLYSLRAKKKLEATLEIGRFRDSAPADSVSFRRSLAAQIGTSVPVEHRVGGVTVFVTKGKRLAIAAWYRERDLFILSIREDYVSPKALIREAIEIES